MAPTRTQLPAGAMNGARGDGQKRRTRAAILAGAARLLAAGRTPTVAEAADAADVSRRTAYRYFPTQDQLLVEAALEALRPEVERSLSAALPDVTGTGTGDDVALAVARLDAAVRVMHRLALANEPLLRTMIRLTTGQVSRTRPPRGFRRIDWIRSAVAPVKARLGPRRFERLVSALASCVGMDSLFVLQDVRGLTATAAEGVTRWMARALLEHSVAEAESTDGHRRTARS
ncbi:MAG: TetR family transcriptional regulator [Gemmatimonadales bacterium]